MLSSVFFKGWIMLKNLAANNISLLSDFAEIEKDLLIKEGSTHFYPRKKLLFRHGDPVTHFYVINSGTVRLFYETPDGCEVTTDFLVAGDTLCSAEIFSLSEEQHSHAVAVNDVTVMKFSIGWLRKTAGQYPSVAFNLLAALSQQTQRLKTETGNQSLMSAVQLAACFLQKSCVLHGLDPAGFDLPYNKSLIASRIGIKMETLSRSFPKLKEIGITVNDRHITFTDLPGIKQNVCDHCSGAEQCSAYKILHPKS
jgi:CRP-like cAMP-binding protein